MSTQEIHGEGRFVKTCQGCKKQFRTNARNARFGPAELCKCLERRAKKRTKRARERRAYHRNPDYHRTHSRIRAEARKIMEWYLRSNGLEPGCAYPGCKHQGWSVWKRILQVHHTWGGDLPPNPPSDGHGGWIDVKAYLNIYCRNHHGLADQAVEKNHLPVLWTPLPKESFATWHLRLRRTNPRKFFMTPMLDLLREYLIGN